MGGVLAKIINKVAIAIAKYRQQPDKIDDGSKLKIVRIQKIAIWSIININANFIESIEAGLANKNNDGKT